MNCSANRYCKNVRWFFSIACLCTISSVTLAEEKHTIIWEDQPLALNKAIKDYVNSEHDQLKSKIKPGKEIRVLYLGFSEGEIEKNAASFPIFPEFDFIHLPYGRQKYYGVPINELDYMQTDTIVALNVDLSRELRDWSEDLEPGNVEISEILDPRGQYIHNLALSLYYVNLRKAGGWGTAVELGAPLDDMKYAEYFYRENLFDRHCSSQIEFTGFDDGRTPLNSMTVYSSAEPASKEQIDCLIMQTLIFTRPASVPFRSILNSD
ncbi:MAG: hypothetical protein K5905_28520 [Roseibium sp.]|uniref:hypothetical protein n=1 Tax=Roseibium sp. TaxID=1936156 RepID=UPI0026273D40|nr:hypothetical protein [Roseibium sp.]MCV0429410.1 hypothetical protein [Roseibium sp.]